MLAPCTATESLSLIPRPATLLRPLFAPCFPGRAPAGSVPCRMAVAALSRSSRQVSPRSSDVSASVSLHINSASFAAAASACSNKAALWFLPRCWWAPSRAGLPPTVALTPTWSSLGSLADGSPEPDVAILSLCRVCLPHSSCAPPSYCKQASVSPQCRRTAAVANSSLQGRLIPSFLVQAR
jgi:hypothetical protein